jgi:hypothetical protein
VEGCYELVPIPDPELKPRKLDVATTYNTERYRPIYANKRGLPVFLNRASQGQAGAAAAVSIATIPSRAARRYLSLLNNLSGLGIGLPMKKITTDDS